VKNSLRRSENPSKLHLCTKNLNKLPIGIRELSFRHLSYMEKNPNEPLEWVEQL